MKNVNNLSEFPAMNAIILNQLRERVWTIVLNVGFLNYFHSGLALVPLLKVASQMPRMRISLEFQYLTIV